jgi:hypothetical protein
LNIRNGFFNIDRIFHTCKEVTKGTGHERIAVFAISCLRLLFLMTFHGGASLLHIISFIRQQGLE